MRGLIKLALIDVDNNKKDIRWMHKIFVMCVIIYIYITTISNGYLKICGNYKEDYELREVQLLVGQGRSNDDLLKVSRLPHVVDAYEEFIVTFDKTYSIDIGDRNIRMFDYLEGRNRFFSFMPLSKVDNNSEHNNVFICGRGFEPSENKKAIIDENTCYLLGFEDCNELLGKKVKIILSDLTIDGIEVVGVNNRIYGPNSTSDYSELAQFYKDRNDNEIIDGIFFSDDVLDELLKSGDVEEWHYQNCKVSIDNTDNIPEFCDTIKRLYDIDSISMVNAIKRRAENTRGIAIVVILTSVVILAGMIIVIINNLIIRLDRRKKYTEMLFKIGYKKEEVISVYILENAILTLKSCVKGITVSFCLCLVTDVFFYESYGSITTFKKFLFLPSLGDVVFFCFVVVMIISCFVFLTCNSQMRKVESEMNLR